jgi:hypothetical protein
VDVNESEVAALVVRGYLAEETRGEPAAIKAAIESVISDMAFELQQDYLGARIGKPESCNQTLFSNQTSWCARAPFLPDRA